MISLPSFLSVVHIVGLALGVGSATVKTVLLLKSNADHSFIEIYLKVARLITRQIILGMVMMTLSGIGWMLLGYPFTSLLVVKLVLFAAIWVMGPIIDNVVEPKFKRLAPQPGEPPSPEFILVTKQYLALEITATLLFYAIIIVWVLGQ